MFKLKLLYLLLAINLMLSVPAAQALFNLSDIGSNILKTNKYFKKLTYHSFFSAYFQNIFRSIVDPIVNVFTSTTSSLLTSTSTTGTTSTASTS